jgi:hypothetical protein
MAGSSEKPQRNETPCLKNAWVRKDAEGDYFLYIRTQNGSGAIINLTAANPSLDEQIKNEVNPERGKSDFIKELFERWLAEQDSSLIRVAKSEDAEIPSDDFPDTIDT